MGSEPPIPIRCNMRLYQRYCCASLRHTSCRTLFPCAKAVVFVQLKLVMSVLYDQYLHHPSESFFGKPSNSWDQYTVIKRGWDLDTEVIGGGESVIEQIQVPS